MTASAASQAPAPIERRAPSAASGFQSGGCGPAGGDMAAPDYAAIAAGNDAGNATAMLPKSDVMDTGQAPGPACGAVVQGH